MTEQDGRPTITTDNGGLLLHVGEETQCVDYATGEAVDLSQLKAGGRVMAWVRRRDGELPLSGGAPLSDASASGGGSVR